MLFLATIKENVDYNDICCFFLKSWFATSESSPKLCQVSHESDAVTEFTQI